MFRRSSAAGFYLSFVNPRLAPWATDLAPLRGCVEPLKNFQPDRASLVGDLKFSAAAHHRRMALQKLRFIHPGLALNAIA